MTRNPLTRFGRWLHERATPERIIEISDGDPYWLSEDRDIVAVWQTEKAQRCPDCGTFGWEWEEYDEPWHPDHYTCRGCELLTKHKREVETTVHDGTKYALFRRPRGD